MKNNRLQKGCNEGMESKRTNEEDSELLNESEILTDEEAKRVILSLYDRGYGIAVYVIERILGTQLTREEREDLVQEGFLRMIIHVEQLHKREPQEQLSYLASAMRNVAVDEGRRRTLCKMLESLDDENTPEPESADLTPEERLMMEEDSIEKKRRMKAVMERLEERDRILLIEKYQNGRSDAEIGKMLGIKTRSVRVYLARARRKAAIYYGEEMDAERNKDQHKDQRKDQQSRGKAVK